jgi:hypothetical protein
MPTLVPPLGSAVDQLAPGLDSQLPYNSGIGSQIKLPEIVNVSTTTHRRCKTPTAARACRTPSVIGWRRARSTG